MNGQTNGAGEAHTLIPGDKPLLVSVPEAARLLGIGLTFAWELVHTGELPTVRLGRRVLVARQILERMASTDQFSHVTKADRGGTNDGTRQYHKARA